jgi:hypothetical protein
MVILLFGAGHLRVTHPSATDPLTIKCGSPFDLHVLGTPPAFILSQDQTLRKIIYGIELTKFPIFPITFQLLKCFPHRYKIILYLPLFVKSDFLSLAPNPDRRFGPKKTDALLPASVETIPPEDRMNLLWWFVSSF